MTSSTNSPTSVHVARRFSAPPEEVFDAWLDPQRIRKWMAPGSAVVRISTDACAGGRFCFIVRRGGDEIAHMGDYIELARPRRLAFRWIVPSFSDDVSIVTIEVTPIDGGAELMLTHEGVHEEYKARTEAGWNAILDVIDHSITS